MIRTHTSFELKSAKLGERVTVAGWIDSKLGGTPCTIELRDQWGKIRIIFDDSSLIEQINRIYLESTIQVTGTLVIIDSTPGMRGEEIEVLSTPIISPQPESNFHGQGMERYLGIRKGEISENLECVANLRKFIRNFLEAEGFTEVDQIAEYQKVSDHKLDWLYLTPSRLSLVPLFGLIPHELEKNFQYSHAPISAHIMPPLGIEGTWLNLGIPKSQNITEILSLVEDLVSGFSKRYNYTVGRFKIERSDQTLALTTTDSGKQDQSPDFVWRYQDPLFYRSMGKLVPRRHEFVAPNSNDINMLTTTPELVRSESYTLVCQGKDLGFAYLRNNHAEIQDTLFQLCQVSNEDKDMLDPIIADIYSYKTELCGLEIQVERLASIFVNEPDITRMFWIV